MTITVIGHGYVGLVTACVFADYGNKVWVIGHTPKKLEMLKNGDPIIYEPGLKELLQKNNKAGRLHFVSSYDEAIQESDIVFITVGTPPKENGEADLSTVFAVAETVAKHLKNGYTVVSCKSTVPVGTNKKVLEILEKNKPADAQVDVASCPEFLREGTALQDTFHPDRIVIGASTEKAIEYLLEIHKPIDGVRVIVGIESAEIIKYASNSILATKISFANLISFLCEKTGANVEQVLEGVGLDKRTGRSFLYPGVGYGGSCFPKDVRALTSTGKQYGVDMSFLESVESINQQARENLYKKVLNHVKGTTVTLWGLAFKPDTDDIRFAPSVYLIEQLLKNNYTVKVYDQEAMDNIKKIFGDKITYFDQAYDAVEGSDALIILTEWNEFKQADLHKVKSLLKTPLIIDGRNIYDLNEMKQLGFTYISTGRAAVV
jgi:UDPglucose 6-dehydrogenase